MLDAVRRSSHPVHQRSGAWDRVVLELSERDVRGWVHLPSGDQVSPSRRLPIERDEFVLYEDGDTVVWLRASGAIQEATWAAICGTSFATEEEARTSGEDWRSRFSRGLSVLSIGADFGDRAGEGGVGEELRKHFKEEFGLELHHDTHGLMVIPDNDHDVFLRAEANVVAMPAAALMEAGLAHGSASPLSPEERVAFDLFSASQFVAHIPDARLVMLVSAVEALVEPETRAPAEIALLARLREQVRREEGITADQRDRLLNAIGNLKRESINQAAQRLLIPFAQREYGGTPAPKFFRKCYAMRSALVHGHAKRPTEHEVRTVGADLENLVGHLIAGHDVVDAVLGNQPFA